MQVLQTLLESPIHATVLPLIGPRRSTKVKMSPSTWQG
jgi:hypothetical protein